LISYEFPLNEKVRTWLRLEDMFDRVQLFTARESARDHEVALARFFELLEAGSRADVKTDLLLELDRQRQMLESLRDNPKVSGEILEEAILETIEAAKALHGAHGKFGQHLRDNEWLMTIRSRFNIPGGTCPFDLPGLHHWLQQPSYVRQGQLQAWQEPLESVRRAMRATLRMLRDSGADIEQVAVNGQFQQMPMARPAQMLRIQLDASLNCVPELSANKYALNIRFVSNEAGSRPVGFLQDVQFLIAYCNL
jgi:cell division protein ZapD